MNKKLLVPLAFLVASTTTVLAGISLQRSLPAPQTRITGDYVEARTASVFCGACHYNSEILNGGREALMAWNFNTGVYHNVNLAGVKAMVQVSADQSLALDDVARHAILAVDSAATDAQVQAVKALVAEKCGKDIGPITSVVRVPISFSHSATSGYKVAGAGFGTLDVSYRTDNGCCTIPGMVWYTPLSPINDRKVGFTESVAFSGSVNNPWQREGEDSAFYGTIAF